MATQFPKSLSSITQSSCQSNCCLHRLTSTSAFSISVECYRPLQLLDWHVGTSSQSGINYQWSDGSDTVYTHWDPANDDEDIVSGECVYMDVSGGWRRADCETPLPGALCHVPPASQCFGEKLHTASLQPVLLLMMCDMTHHFLLSLTGSKPFISYEVVCPSTWVKFGQGCYNFEPVVQKLTFEEAREHCRQKGRDSADVIFATNYLHHFCAAFVCMWIFMIES